MISQRQRLVDACIGKKEQSSESRAQHSGCVNRACVRVAVSENASAERYYVAPITAVKSPDVICPLQGCKVRFSAPDLVLTEQVTLTQVRVTGVGSTTSTPNILATCPAEALCKGSAARPVCGLNVKLGLRTILRSTLRAHGRPSNKQDTARTCPTIMAGTQAASHISELAQELQKHCSRLIAKFNVAPPEDFRVGSQLYIGAVVPRRWHSTLHDDGVSPVVHQHVVINQPQLT